jgi:hypothetical protein
MTDIKTLEIIRCKRCGIEYYCGKTKAVIQPEDELYFAIRSVSQCKSCKEHIDRTAGGFRKPLNDNKY